MKKGRKKTHLVKIPVLVKGKNGRMYKSYRWKKKDQEDSKLDKMRRGIQDETNSLLP